MVILLVITNILRNMFLKVAIANPRWLPNQPYTLFGKVIMLNSKIVSTLIISTYFLLYYWTSGPNKCWLRHQLYNYVNCNYIYLTKYIFEGDHFVIQDGYQTNHPNCFLFALLNPLCP